MEKCEKSGKGCELSGRVKRQSITVHKMPLGACMQALQEEKPMEVCHSTHTGKDDLDSFSCVSSTVLTKRNQRESTN